ARTSAPAHPDRQGDDAHVHQPLEARAAPRHARLLQLGRRDRLAHRDRAQGEPHQARDPRGQRLAGQQVHREARGVHPRARPLERRLLRRSSLVVACWRARPPEPTAPEETAMPPDLCPAAARLVGRLEVRHTLRAVDRLLAARGPLAAGTAEVVVYFPDGAVNLYQLRQWYEPLRHLARTHPVVIVTRTAHATHAALRESALPVVQLRRIGDYEAWLATQRVRAVLYVNQNVRNFSALRFAEPAHVFISHGESDKAYMASNQAKAYDHVLVAGQAAVDRLERAVVGIDPARLVPIGRPQLDVEHEAPALPADGRTVVLYAPTWEGDRPSMSYSSVASHGHQMVAALTATGRHRVIYRPHPRTGLVDREHARADSQLRAALEAANRADPAAHHLVDLGGDYGWQLAHADFCVTDVSAVAFDWLATS